MQDTKLGKFCNGLIEAGWLAAVVIAPLFFNTYSSRVFEPDKASLVRSIALIIVAAWLIKLLEEGGLHFKNIEMNQRRWWDSWAQIPLVVPLIIFLSSYILSSLLSIYPLATWWGSYTRLQGAYSTAAYVIIFLAIAGNLRRRAQVERLISTIILTSLPISVYGIMQRMLFDPLPWGEDTVQRITSTMGNAIFVGSYLIMVVPFTIMRAMQEFRAIINEEGNLGDHIARASVYSLTCVAQLVALWFSNSRGPLLGLLMGMFFWMILMSLIFKRNRLTLTTLGIAGALGVFLLLLNIPGTPLEPIRNSDNFLGRVGRIFDQGGTGRVRELIWEGAVKMALPHEPFLSPEGKPDPFNVLRPLIGHGPESIYVAYNPFYNPELAHYEKRSATPDRSHNETFDSLLTTGAIGMIAYLAFFAAIIYYGLKWIGVVAPEDKKLYIALYVGGGIIGAIVMVVWRGPSYFGVGLPFGIIIGLLGYLSFIALKRTPADIDPWRTFILVSLVSSIVAHFVEIHFGIAITSTRTHFWLFVGMLFAIGWVIPKIATQKDAVSAPVAAKTEIKRKSPQSVAPRIRYNMFSVMFPSFITGLILITMTYDFVANARQVTSAGELFRAFLTTLYGTTGEPSYGMAIMLGFVWLSCSLIFNDDLQAILITLMGSLSIWLSFTFVHLIGLVNIAGYQPNTSAQLTVLLNMINGILFTYTLWVVFILFMMGTSLAPEMPISFLRWNVQIITAPFLLAVAISAGYLTNTLMVQADMTYKVAQPLDRQQRWDIAIPVYQHAIKLAVEQDQYYLYLGRAYLEAASKQTERAQQEGILAIAAHDLETAQKLNPLNPDHSANLARLTEFWSRTTTDPAETQIRIDHATEYYKLALRLSPNTPWLWNEVARYDLRVRKNSADAQSKIERAIAIDPQLAETYNLYAEYWTQRGAEEKDTAKQKEYYQKAIEAYRKAFTANYKADLTTELTNRSNIAAIQRTITDTEGAIETYKDIIKSAGKDYNLWEVNRALAELYLQKGDKTAALDFANKSLASAPAANKPTIQALINLIGK